METLISILFTGLLTIGGLIFAMVVIKKEDRKAMSPEEEALEEALYETQIREDNVKSIIDAQIQHQMGNGAEPVAITLRKGL